MLRYSRGDNRNGFSVTGMGYRADWDSTDQVAERAIASGAISGFLLHNNLNLFSDFTYFLDDEEHGDVYAQTEIEWTHAPDHDGALTGDPADPVTPLVRARGAEVGVRTVGIPGLQSTVALWYLGLDSELLFVGDAGTTEAGRPSRRVGIEWTNYSRLAPWLTVDGDLALSRARFGDDDPAGDYIPGALDRVISAGLTAEPRRPICGSVRVRHFGPRPSRFQEGEGGPRTVQHLQRRSVGYRLLLCLSPAG